MVLLVVPEMLSVPDLTGSCVFMMSEAFTASCEVTEVTVLLESDEIVREVEGISVLLPDNSDGSLLDELVGDVAPPPVHLEESVLALSRLP